MSSSPTWGCPTRMAYGEAGRACGARAGGRRSGGRVETASALDYIKVSVDSSSVPLHERAVARSVNDDIGLPITVEVTRDHLRACEAAGDSADVTALLVQAEV